MSVVDGMVAANFTDPHNERIIFLAAGGLLALAVIVAVVTVLWWRSTRSEHPALAPLEVMGTRKFQHVDPAERQAVLDEVRTISDGRPDDLIVHSDHVDLIVASADPLPDLGDLLGDAPDVPATDSAVEPPLEPAVEAPAQSEEVESADDVATDEEPAEPASAPVAVDESVEPVEPVEVAGGSVDSEPADDAAEPVQEPATATE